MPPFKTRRHKLLLLHKSLLSCIETFLFVSAEIQLNMEQAAQIMQGGRNGNMQYSYEHSSKLGCKRLAKRCIRKDEWP